MEFGKVGDINQVDFSFGEVPDFTNQLLAALPVQTEPPAIYFGCTGWGMKEWIGKYYPLKTKSQEFLYHYSRQFSTIELNTTHYRIPTEEMIKNWYRLADANFKFSPKIPQTISHSNNLGLFDGQTELFCKNILGLKDKLGVSFMQLPPNFGPNNIAVLEQFLQQFPTDEVPLAIEVRQEEWFSESSNFNAFLELLNKHQVGTVITDVAGRRDALHLGLTTSCVMIRFVGNTLHQTDYERVDAWVDLFLNWIEKGLREVYFFSHQPDNILSPEMCIYLIQQVEEKSKIRFLKKTKVIDDGQMSLF